MHQVEKDYEPRNWKVYLIKLNEPDQKPPISELDINEGIYVTANGALISDEAEWVVSCVEGCVFGAACKRTDRQPEWKPKFLLYDYEIIAAEAVNDGKHYAPLDLGFLTTEWRGHKPGALVMSLPTHLGPKFSPDEQGFTWMVEVI
jgi:hypothetical protein